MSRERPTRQSRRATDPTGTATAARLERPEPLEITAVQHVDDVQSTKSPNLGQRLAGWATGRGNGPKPNNGSSAATAHRLNVDPLSSRLQEPAIASLPDAAPLNDCAPPHTPSASSALPSAAETRLCDATPSPEYTSSPPSGVRASRNTLLSRLLAPRRLANELATPPASADDGSGSDVDSDGLAAADVATTRVAGAGNHLHEQQVQVQAAKVGGGVISAASNRRPRGQQQGSAPQPSSSTARQSTLHLQRQQPSHGAAVGRQPQQKPQKSQPQSAPPAPAAAPRRAVMKPIPWGWGASHASGPLSMGTMPAPQRTAGPINGNGSSGGGAVHFGGTIRRGLGLSATQPLPAASARHNGGSSGGGRHAALHTCRKVSVGAPAANPAHASFGDVLAARRVVAGGASGAAVGVRQAWSSGGGALSGAAVVRGGGFGGATSAVSAGGSATTATSIAGAECGPTPAEARAAAAAALSAVAASRVASSPKPGPASGSGTSSGPVSCSSQAGSHSHGTVVAAATAARAPGMSGGSGSGGGGEQQGAGSSRGVALTSRVSSRHTGAGNAGGLRGGLRGVAGSSGGDGGVGAEQWAAAQPLAANGDAAGGDHNASSSTTRSVTSAWLAGRPLAAELAQAGKAAHSHAGALRGVTGLTTAIGVAAASHRGNTGGGGGGGGAMLGSGVHARHNARVAAEAAALDAARAATGMSGLTHYPVVPAAVMSSAMPDWAR